MNIKDLINIGSIQKTHGTQGEVQVFFDFDMPDELEDIRALFILITPNKVPFMIEEFSFISSNQAYIKFEDINSNEEARQFVGNTLLIPKEMLPNPDGDFYSQEIIGYEVSDKNKGLIGNIKEILKYPSQEILQIMYNEKEILIPISEALITEINHNKKIVYVNTPDGLIDIYL